MFKFFTVSIAILASVGLTSGALAQGGELDNEQQVIEQAKANFAKDLPAAVVVKVNPQDGSVAVYHSDLKIAPADVANFAKDHANDFTPVTEKQKRGELDRDSSQSSWFFGFGWGYAYGAYQPYYYYPTYYYNSYSYAYSYYNYYNWGGCNYYYYGNPYYRWY